MSGTAPLAAFLQNELTGLANEARRKHPEIKEAAEKLLLQVRVAKERAGAAATAAASPSVGAAADPVAAQLAKLPDTLRPFELACATGQPKLVAISVNCLQRLVTLRALPLASVGTVLQLLGDGAREPQELQLKVLQTAVPLFANYDVHGASVFQVLLLCFRLQEARAAVVANTAAATLRQLVVHVFDKAAAESSAPDRAPAQDADVADAERVLATEDTPEGSTGKTNGAETQDLSQVTPVASPAPAAGATQRRALEATANLGPSLRDAWLLFLDICLLSGGETPLHLTVGKRQFKRVVGLELIEGILANHAALLASRAEFVDLLKQNACPLLLKTLSEPAEFATTLRLTRVVSLMIRELHATLRMECEIFLAMFSRALEIDGTPLWHRCLLLETQRAIAADARLVRSLFDTFDAQQNASDVVQDMVAAFSKVLMSERVLGVLQTAGTVAPLQPLRVAVAAQLDKTDPPAITDAYLALLALQGVLAMSDSLVAGLLPPNLPAQLLVASLVSAPVTVAQSHGRLGAAAGAASGGGGSELSPIVLLPSASGAAATSWAMLVRCWPGMLSCLSFLLPLASLRDELYVQVLEAFQSLSIVLGGLASSDDSADTSPTVARDSFLLCLCRVAVPAHLLSDGAMQFEKIQIEAGVVDAPAADRPAAAAGVHNLRALSTAAPAAAPTAGGAILTERHVFALKALLNVVACAATRLDVRAWYLVLETLQVADRLVQTGRVSSGGNGSGPAGSTDAPVAAAGALDAQYVHLIMTMRRLFEGRSRHMTFDVLQGFVEALCKLSVDHSASSAAPTAPAGGSAAPSGDPALSFGLARLFEVVMSNVGRLVAPETQLSAAEVAAKEGDRRALLWQHICAALVQIAHGPSTIPAQREQSCVLLGDALTAAAQTRHEAVELRVTLPLQQLVAGVAAASPPPPFEWDVARRGIETLDKILQSSGQHLTRAWSVVLAILEDVAALAARSRSAPVSSNKALRTLVRTAFPPLQLVISDFMGLLDGATTLACVRALHGFSAQTEDVNIALTSVTCLWKVSDAALRARSVADASAAAHATETWLLALRTLQQLSADARADLRNSATQTLFRTLALTGDQLSLQVWDECIEHVLFPLLATVAEAAAAAGSAAAAGGSDAPALAEGMLVHHSRNTVGKQWDETSVLALNGVAKALRDRLAMLAGLPPGEFAHLWGVYFDHVRDACLSHSAEVALAGHRCFRQSLQTLRTAPESAAGPVAAQAVALWERVAHVLLEERAHGVVVNPPKALQARWRTRAWPAFAERHALPGAARLGTPDAVLDRVLVGPLAPELLAQLAGAVPDLVALAPDAFDAARTSRVLGILSSVLLYHAPEAPPNTPSAPPGDVSALTPLQKQVVDGVLAAEMFPRALVLPHVARLCVWPLAVSCGQAAAPGAAPLHAYAALARRVAPLLAEWACDPAAAVDDVELVVEALGWPMQLKYALPRADAPLWRVAADELGRILDARVPAGNAPAPAETAPSDDEFYAKVAWVLDGFLLPPAQPPASLSVEDIEADEAGDLAWLARIQTALLPALVAPGTRNAVPAAVLDTVRRASRLYVTHRDVAAAAAAGVEAAAVAAGDAPSSPPKTDRARLERERGRQAGDTSAVALASDVLPVVREKFAVACLDLLFQLCADPRGRRESARANPADADDARFRIAVAAFPVMLTRCASVLRAYVSDRPMFGRCPLPRMRSDEIAFILSSLVRLELRPGIAVSGPLLAGTTGESATSPSADQDTRSVLHQTILSGRAAHLFLLYGLLVDCLGLGFDGASAQPAGLDEQVFSMFRRCLSRIGDELGLDAATAVVRGLGDRDQV